MAAYDKNLTHEAFVSRRGKPIDMDARGRAITKTIAKYYKANKTWPRRTTIAQLLNTHATTLGLVVNYLIEQEEVELAPSGEVSLKEVHVEEQKEPVQEEVEHDAPEACEEPPAPFAHDNNYLNLINALAREEEICADLKAHEKIRNALKASIEGYVRGYNTVA